MGDLDIEIDWPIGEHLWPMVMLDLGLGVFDEIEVDVDLQRAYAWWDRLVDARAAQSPPPAPIELLLPEQVRSATAFQVAWPCLAPDLARFFPKALRPHLAWSQFRLRSRRSDGLAYIELFGIVNTRSDHPYAQGIRAFLLGDRLIEAGDGTLSFHQRGADPPPCPPRPHPDYIAPEPLTADALRTFGRTSWTWQRWSRRSSGSQRRSPSRSTTTRRSAVARPRPRPPTSAPTGRREPPAAWSGGHAPSRAPSGGPRSGRERWPVAAQAVRRPPAARSSTRARPIDLWGAPPGYGYQVPRGYQRTEVGYSNQPPPLSKSRHSISPSHTIAPVAPSCSRRNSDRQLTTTLPPVVNFAVPWGAQAAFCVNQAL